MENLKKACIKYNAGQDRYEIWTNPAGEWLLYKSFKCQPNPYNGETDFIHYNALEEINKLVNMGFLIVMRTE